MSLRVARSLAARVMGVWLASLCVALALNAGVHAASLGVSPTLIDMSDAQMASGVRVRNRDAERAVHVQARIFRWTQQAGQEVYAPTDAVVVSPPIVRIEPGEENLIRIVRTGKRAVRGEDSYRLLLDELPEPGQAQAGAVTLMIRQSLPVFVSPAQAVPARAQWRIERVTRSAAGASDKARAPRKGYLVTVTNTGDKRLRLADLALHDANGALLAQQRGLVGYALGGSSVSWFIPEVAAHTAPSGDPITLSAQSETGPIRLDPLPVQPGDA